MAIYLLLALLASLSGCAANCGHCAVCASSQCTSCVSTFYLPTSTSDCTSCSGMTCPSGQYYSALLCGPGVDNGCRACSVCGAGYYQTAACGATTNTVCAACSVCGAGYYQTAACTATTNTVCAACNTCSSGEYRSGGCSGTTNSVCSACSGVTCPSGQYYCASVCGPAADNGCRACSVCGAGYFRTAACTATTNTVCAACTIGVITASPCPETEYWLASACGGTDKGCRACSSVIPCPLGHYWDSERCGVLALHAYADNGCRECTDCVTSTGKRTKSWGICNGVSGTENPESACLNPGPALCRLCLAEAEEWGLDGNGDPWLDCTGDEDHDWIFLPGKGQGDLDAACHAARLEELRGVNSDCYWETWEVDLPIAAKKSCLYNMVVDAMGIYNHAVGGWPLPTPYPADPFNVTGP